MPDTKFTSGSKKTISYSRDGLLQTDLATKEVIQKTNRKNLNFSARAPTENTNFNQHSAGGIAEPQQQYFTLKPPDTSPQENASHRNGPAPTAEPLENPENRGENFNLSVAREMAQGEAYAPTKVNISAQTKAADNIERGHIMFTAQSRQDITLNGSSPAAPPEQIMLMPRPRQDLDLSRCIAGNGEQNFDFVNGIFNRPLLEGDSPAAYSPNYGDGIPDMGRGYRTNRAGTMLRFAVRQEIKQKTDEFTEDNVATFAVNKYEQGGIDGLRYTIKSIQNHTKKGEHKKPSSSAANTKFQQKMQQQRNQVKLYAERVKSAVTKNGTRSVASGVGNLMWEGVKSNKAVLLIGGGVGLFILIIYAVIAMITITTTTSFLADETTVNDTAIYITQLTADLQEKFDTVETQPQYGHINEFRKEIHGNLQSSVTELVAYLTVLYQDFTLEQAKPIIGDLSGSMYEFKTKEVVEEREREVTTTTVDPDTGLETESTSTEKYDYYILNVEIFCKPFRETPAFTALTPDELEQFEILIETGGNMMLGGSLGNPFVGYDWRNNITTDYGMRVNPVSHRKEMHPALDIAMDAGTEIYAVQDGNIVKAVHGDSIYGNYIEIEDDKGLRTKYAHCSALLITSGSVLKGDVIAKVGTTGQSTGNHLHIEVWRDGAHRNPITELSFN